MLALITVDQPLKCHEHTKSVRVTHIKRFIVHLSHLANNELPAPRHAFSQMNSGLERKRERERERIPLFRIFPVMLCDGG